MHVVGMFTTCHSMVSPTVPSYSTNGPEMANAICGNYFHFQVCLREHSVIEIPRHRGTSKTRSFIL